MATPISDDESVTDSSSEEEPEPVPAPKEERRGRPKGSKTKPRTAEQELKETIIDSVPMRGRGKKQIEAKITGDPVKKSKKKVSLKEPEVEELPPHMGGEPIKKVKEKKPKREVSPETRERLRKQLEKGRATRAANYAKKREEREKLLESVKMKIAEPTKEVVHHYHSAPEPKAAPAPAPAPKKAAAPKPRPMPVFV